MSACAVVAEPQLASPELALVDPALAAELRRELRPSEGVRHLPRARVEEVPVAIEASMLEEPIVPDAPYVEQGAEHFQDDDYALAFVEEAGAQETPAATAASAPSSHYPVLPAPELDDANGTDAALRQIRARLTEEVPARERRLRRRFTIASVASAVYALVILALDIQLQVADFPTLPGF